MLQQSTQKKVPALYSSRVQEVLASDEWKCNPSCTAEARSVHCQQIAPAHGAFFFLVHPPVLTSAPLGEGNHGHATVHYGFTCWSVWGVSPNSPK
jgi:hypothetical protein|mmetsp:Transcript_59639/g.98326  ORF Transcript_59639/g.98326 Transcript_59639/m.98326 type:complete len:95 (+) Transcript_59639:1874-2158(+)